MNLGTRTSRNEIFWNTTKFALKYWELMTETKVQGTSNYKGIAWILIMDRNEGKKTKQNKQNLKDMEEKKIPQKSILYRGKITKFNKKIYSLTLLPWKDHLHISSFGDQQKECFKDCFLGIKNSLKLQSQENKKQKRAFLPKFLFRLRFHTTVEPVWQLAAVDWGSSLTPLLCSQPCGLNSSLVLKLVLFWNLSKKHWTL